MNKFLSLMFAFLCYTLLTLPASAQLPEVVSGTKTLIRMPEEFMYVMQQMSAEALQFNGTLTALVANTHSLQAKEITSFEQYINNTWPSRAQTAMVWQAPKLNVQEAAQMLVQQKPLSELSEAQAEDFYLISYPALLLEGPFTADPNLLSHALAYYRSILAKQAVKATLSNALTDWARSMAAVTDLGFFGTANDVFLILQNAKKIFPAQVTPWTDLITVQALLQYEAYDAIKELAQFRLKQFENGRPVRLNSYWYYITEYMTSIGHPLPIHTNTITGPFAQEPLSSDLQTLLAQYNPYNLFYIEPSANMFENSLELRQNLLAKMQYAKTASQQALEQATVQRLTTNYTKSISSQPELQPTTFSGRTPTATHAERLVRRALKERAILRQQIQLKQAELNSTPLRKAEKRAQLEKELSDLQIQHQAADTRLHQIRTEYAKNTPADKISYLTYAEPLTPHTQVQGVFFSHLNPASNKWEKLQSFQASIVSNEDASLKQALLERAETDFVQARTAALTKNTDENLLRYKNAKHKLTYIQREIANGTPYQTIAAYAYPVAPNSTVFEIPSMSYRFEGNGQYASFESPVKNKADGEAKQQLFNNLYQTEVSLQQQIVTYQYEINALEKNTRLFGKNARANKLADFKNKLNEAKKQLSLAQQRTEQVLQQIKQGADLKDIR